MPLPTPNEDEDKESFMDRCLSNETVLDDFGTDEDGSASDQAVAVCNDLWERRNERARTSEMRSAKGQLGGKTRTEEFMGRTHLVTPVVALVEGVMQAANAPGPEFVPGEVLQRNAPGWNGRPVTLDHPQRDGQLVLANQPEVLEQEIIGRVFNARAEDNKLKMEAWIDRDRALQMGGEPKRLVERLMADDLVEVSIGALIEVAEAGGEFAQEALSGVWQLITPDHLAMLPEGAEGACSIEDGCGTPRAAKGQCNCGGGCCMTDDQENDEEQTEREASRSKKFLARIFGRDEDEIERALDKFAEEVTMEIEEKVEGLIQDERTRFEEGDREFLRGLEAEQLDKLYPREAEGNADDDSAPAADGGDGEPHGAAASGEGDEEPESLEEFLKQAPPHLRDALNEQVRVYNEERTDLIGRIRASESCEWSHEELQSWSLEDLRRTAKLVRPEPDYSGLAGAHVPETRGDEGPPKMPSVTERIANRKQAH